MFIKYRILQLDTMHDNGMIRYKDYNETDASLITPNRYKIVYENYGDHGKPNESDIQKVLEHLFFDFNNNLPSTYKGYKLKVSDIIGVKVDKNKYDYYYINSMDFTKLEGFDYNDV